MFVDLKSLGTDNVTWCRPMRGLGINCVGRGRHTYIHKDIATYRMNWLRGQFVEITFIS